MIDNAFTAEHDGRREPLFGGGYPRANREGCQQADHTHGATHDLGDESSATATSKHRESDSLLSEGCNQNFKEPPLWTKYHFLVFSAPNLRIFHIQTPPSLSAGFGVSLKYIPLLSPGPTCHQTKPSLSAGFGVSLWVVGFKKAMLLLFEICLILLRTRNYR